MTDLLTPSSVIDALAADLRHEPVAPEQVVEGAPMVGSLALANLDDGTEIGVWELTPGTMSDTEVDETFVVLAGEGTVRFLGDESVLQLRPGIVGRLVAGDRTEWSVKATLRKVYIA